MFTHIHHMPRIKIIPDSAVFNAVHRLLAENGEKSVSFATVGKATGLAAPTLVQRFGSRDGMVKAAQLAAWDKLDAITAAAINTTADKGPHTLLKAVEPGLTAMPPNARDPDLHRRAAGWRATMESALSLRLGGGEKGREAASLLFAAWQGQVLWSGTGGRGFRLKDAARKLT
jgi:AcrR family transcriptional regulator